MGNIEEELLEMESKKKIDRYLRSIVVQLSDMFAEGKHLEAAKRVQQVYVDGYEEGFVDCRESMQ